MRPPNRLTQRRRNINRLDLRTLPLLPLQRHRIRHHQLTQPLAPIQILNRISTQNPMRADRQHLGRPVRFHRVRRLAQRARRIAHVVDQHRHFSGDFADEYHFADHARFGAFFVDHCEIGAQPVGD